MRALRYIIIILLVLMIGTAIVWRLVYLQVITQPFLKKQSDARTIRTIILPAKRGMISDRNGVPLAISVPVDTIWIDPKHLEVQPEQWQQLVSLLGLDQSSVDVQLARKSQSRFMYLKRQIPPPLAEKVKALHIPGVYIQREYKRFYPSGEVFANVIGITNIDNKGQEGIELGYNSRLTGKPGKQVVVRDLFGNIIKTLSYHPAQPGGNLTLTLDDDIQYLTYQALKSQVIKNKADGGSAVIIDARNGEILAMANYPSFNPNDRANLLHDAMRNRAMTDAFEPGSVLKSLAMAVAVDKGVVKPGDRINTAPGKMEIQGHIVQDYMSHGTISLSQILQKSSNVGISKVTLRLPDPALLPQKLREMGFGSPTGIAYPGESSGTVADLRSYQKFSIATMAFGYGIATTTLQLALGYAILAHHGQQLIPSLIKTKVPIAQNGIQVVSAKTAKQVLDMMETVLQPGGTATRYRVWGYEAAAKTGTARKAIKGKYSNQHHVSTFVGIIPAAHPRYVMAIIVDDPRAGIFNGGPVAGPVYSSVMRQIMPQTMPPDKV